MPIGKKYPGHGTDLGKTLPEALEAWARFASGGVRQKTFPGLMTFVRGPEDLLMVAKVAIPHLSVGWEGGQGDHLADFMVTLQSEGLLDRSIAYFTDAESHWDRTDRATIIRYIADKLDDETSEEVHSALFRTLELLAEDLEGNRAAIYWLMNSRSSAVRKMSIPLTVSDKELEEEAWLHWDRDVREIIASLDGVEEDVLRRLTRDRDSSVAEAAVANLVAQGLPPEDEFDDDIHDEAVGYFISHSEDPDTILRAAASTSSEETLIQILDRTNEPVPTDNTYFGRTFKYKVGCAIAGNSNASEEVLKKVLYESLLGEEKIIKIVMDNPNVTSKILLLIASPSRTGKDHTKSLVTHPKATPEIISALLSYTNALELRDTLDLIVNSDVLTDEHIDMVAEIVGSEFGIGEERIPMTASLSTVLSQLLMHPKGGKGADHLAGVILSLSSKQKQLNKIAKLRLKGAFS